MTGPEIDAARAEIARLTGDVELFRQAAHAEAGIARTMFARAEKAEAQVAAVQALCDAGEPSLHEAVYIADVRAALDDAEAQVTAVRALEQQASAAPDPLAGRIYQDETPWSPEPPVEYPAATFCATHEYVAPGLFGWDKSRCVFQRVVPGTSPRRANVLNQCGLPASDPIHGEPQ